MSPAGFEHVMTVLKRASNNCKRQTYTPVKEDVTEGI
jgi:hypothetical protein